MSTILKALRRLEHDRSARSGRPLRQEVASAPEARPRRWPLLIAAVVCGIAAGPLALVVWTELLPRTGAPESPAALVPSVASEALAAAPSMAREAAARSLPSEAVETLPLPESPAPVVPDERVVEEFVAEAPPAPIVSSDVEMLKRPAPDPRIAALPDDVPARPAGPRPGSVRPRPSPKRALVAERPPVSTPPPPALRVERTEWHPSPQRRVAVVELDGSGDPLRLHEGDVVGALVVGEIQPSTVTFYHEGIELHRRVGDRP